MIMAALQVNKLLEDRILVTREAARLLEGALRSIMSGGKPTETDAAPAMVTIDFNGVEGIAPSFLDELLTVFEGLLAPEPGSGGRSIVVANPPNRLSSKFEAIARGHGMSIRALDDGSWLLSESRDHAA